MESVYEFDSLFELPPLPLEINPMECSPSYPFVSSSSSSAVVPLESLPPFPSSDFPTYRGFTFSDNQDLLQLEYGADSSFLDSSLPLITHHHLSESTRLEEVFHDDEPTPFLHLPDLQSYEQTANPAPFLPLSPPHVTRHVEKRRRINKSTVTNSSRKISDKIRSLEKLMPWDKKLNLANILEEAYNYIRFLQSQIGILRLMPLESVYCTAIEETNLLKSLTRQQILQVVMNSLGARNVFYTRGVCVVSYEQLLSVTMIAQSARKT